MRLFKTIRPQAFHKISPGLLILLFSLVAIGILKTQTRFDESAFQMSRVVLNTQNLSSKTLQGRGIATTGQVLTEGYLEQYFQSQGLAYQTVTTQALVPQWQSDAFIKAPSLKALKLYEDFRPTADYYGKGLKYTGDLLYLGQDLFMLPPALLKDKVVVIQTNRLTTRQLDYLVSAQAAGVLYEVTAYFGTAADPRALLSQRDLSLKSKHSASLFTAQISTETSQALANLALAHSIPGYQPGKVSDMAIQYDRRIVGLIKNCSLDVPLDFKQVLLKHYMVTVKGKQPGKSTSFVTHYDGNGAASSNAKGTFKPGVVDGASSTALLLELALTAAHQNAAPKHDINFIFMEGLNNSLQPSQALYKTLSERYSYNELFILEGVGTKTSSISLQYDAYNDLSRMSAATLYRQLDRFPAAVVEGGGLIKDWSAYEPFMQSHNALLFISGQSGEEAFIPGGEMDSLSNLNTDQLAAAAALLLGHMDLNLFTERRYEFIQVSHLIGIGLLGLLVYLLRRAHALLRLILDTLIPFGISLVLINLILCIPKDANLKVIADVTVTNFSLYETLRTSYLGLLGFFSLFSASSESILSEISLYLGRSFILISWGLLIAIGFGLLIGLVDSYRQSRGRTTATWTSIILYSIPDVLVAFLGLVAVVFLAKWPLTAQWLDPEFTRKYLMPLISLCVVPSIYIARLVFVALEAELQKDYVAFLRYKGLSRLQIYSRHFSKVGFMKILDMAKPIIMLLFSNLMIVEYLFNYPGIMFDLLSKRGEPLMVISMALSVGLSFTALYGLSQLLALAIAPRRSRS